MGIVSTIFFILKDISVEQGSIIPWFNQPGQGTQIISSEDIEELILN